MPEEIKSHDVSPSRQIKKLTLPDGFRVGIVNLDNILQEVADMRLADSSSIKEELLKRVKDQNYVPSTAESDYSVALYYEYKNKFGEFKDRIEIKKLTGG